MGNGGGRGGQMGVREDERFHAGFMQNLVNPHTRLLGGLLQPVDSQTELAGLERLDECRLGKGLEPGVQ